MKFICQQCKAKYRIDDTKIHGRTLKMKCRKCGSEIVVRTSDSEVGHEAEALDAGAAHSEPPAAAPAKRISENPLAAKVAQKLHLSPQAALARKTPSSVGTHAPQAQAVKTTSTLATEFRRNPLSVAPAAAAAPLPQEWHIAIDDKPIGPISSQELRKHVEDGKAHGESLVWREGFDDWRPLKDVAELSWILDRRSSPRLVAAPKPAVGSKPGLAAKTATVGALGAKGREPSGQMRVTPSPQRPAASTKTESAHVAPIGGRLGATAAPVIQKPVASHASPIASSAVAQPSATAVPEVQPLNFELRGDDTQRTNVEEMGTNGKGLSGAHSFSASGPLPLAVAAIPKEARVSFIEGLRRSSYYKLKYASQRLPVGAWMAIVGAGAFGVALAIMAGMRMWPAEKHKEAALAAAGQPQGQSEQEQGPDLDLNDKPGSAQVTTLVQGNKVVARKTSSGGEKKAVEEKIEIPSNGKELSAEQKALLARMGGGANDGLAEVQLDKGGSKSAKTGGVGLEANQLRDVVTRNRPALQRCYETAIRGSSQTQTVRLDVQLTVGASGSVTKVNTQGPGIGNMSDCIERSVRRWRFPSATDSTQTSFPVVFQPGG